MRLIFAGTPEFAQVALAALHAAGHDVALVLTQPDRPAGRGMKLQASPVKAWALAHGVPVAQPRSLRLDGAYPQDAQAAQQALQATGAQAMIVAAYGLILPQWVLDLPPRGCLNIHASLLPRWRGAAPIHRAIEAGDAQTGITIMQMDAGLDTGAMLWVRPEAIAPTDTTASLHDRLAALGGQCMVDTLAALDTLTPTPQPTQGVSYAHKLQKAESTLDWALPAPELARRIRAFDPFPGASTSWPLGTKSDAESNAKSSTETVKIWQAHAETGTHCAAPGTVLQADACGVCVACGVGADGLPTQLRLTQLQRPGGKRVDAAQFVHSSSVAVGQVLGLISAPAPTPQTKA